MDFFRNAIHNHRMKDPVRGEGLVVEINSWLAQGRTPYTLEATLVVEADGVPKTTVEHSEIVNASTGSHLERWPEQGDTIPVTVDRADPTRVRIDWDSIRSKAEILAEREKEQSEARKQELLAQAYDEGGDEAGREA